MRLSARLTLTGFVLASLVACSAPAPEPQDEEEARELGRDTDETVFDDMIDTQDRARAVEDLSYQYKSDLDATIERQESGEAAQEEP
jgi:hypothetical protein